MNFLSLLLPLITFFHLQGGLVSTRDSIVPLPSYWFWRRSKKNAYFLLARVARLRVHFTENACDNFFQCSDEEERIRMIYSRCREETQIEDGKIRGIRFFYSGIATFIFKHMTASRFFSGEIESFRRMELPSTSKGRVSFEIKWPRN
jgi:hypothetical protein